MNHLALVQAVRGPMAESLFVDGEGQGLINVDKIHYYGLSQGHIFGTTVATYDPHITRAVLGVGGANYSMMLERSLDWPVYRNTVIGAYDDPLNVAIIISLMQMRWDTTEPVNITPFPNGELGVVWKDGHESYFPGHALRCACGCAVFPRWRLHPS